MFIATTLSCRTGFLIKTVSISCSMFFLLFVVTSHSIVSAQEKLYFNEFPLEDVKITAGPFKHALELNADVLLKYDPDRLLAPFLREAGLPLKAETYGNWEKDGLDGHIGGHYLTAMAIHYAATGNEEFKKRMDYMVVELRRCQEASKHGKGYIGGFPVTKQVRGESVNLWNEIRKGNVGVIWNYWVPWYNLHKTYAGLRDAWVYGKNDNAKTVFLNLCDWGIDIISNLDERQMESMLANEFGGMNEVYADAYQITGDKKYLDAAVRFSHKEIFDNMAKCNDNLDNRHANTQVPKAVGYQRVAELNKEQDFITAAEFFWKTVVYNRSLSLGGNSRSEHFPEANKCSDYMHERQGPESCNTNNMMKLTEGLFRMNPKAEYADYFERAMYNHILSTQHPEHGGYVYFTPARPAHYRVYSAPEEAMWCCVGTGMENHGKYGQFIYTRNKANDGVYVNLFVPSELNWKDKKVKITQFTDFPEQEGSTLIINPSEATQFKLFIRYPSWVAPGEMQILCNGVDYAKGAKPSSYIEIDRKWGKNDKVEIKTPMHVRIEELPNLPNAISVMRGPILLCTKTGTENMPGLIAGSGRWEHIAHGPLMSVFDTPYIIGERSDILNKLNNMKPVAGKSFTYIASDLFIQEQYKDLHFEPFYNIHDSRYMMYFLSMNESEFKEYRQAIENEEKDKMILDKRTVDMVSAGEQQPESDHGIKSQNSHRGHHEGEAWRDARNGGYFEYTLSTQGMEDLSLMLRYWGNEGGNRMFDILIDGQVLITENLREKWSKDLFYQIEYDIPVEFLKSKKKITVTFRPKADNIAGGVFAVRLLMPESKVTGR